MSVIGSNILAGASGSAAGEALYVDDVFSTYLYEGTGSAQTITNDIDLAGEGGLVWVKGRHQVNPRLHDSERGANASGYFKALRTDGNNAEYDALTAGVNAFNSNGFGIGGVSTPINSSDENYVSWTFRKAPGFFDVITYNGQSNGGVDDTWFTVSHNLGSTPGFILIKSTSLTENWVAWHRSDPTSIMYLNSTGASSSSNYDTTFGHANGAADANNIYIRAGQYAAGRQGESYVAYVFAHDDQSFGTAGDESIIKCGTFTTDSTGKASIDLGWEAQFALIKRIDSSQNWYLVDTMRGWVAPGSSTYSNFLRANANNAETVSGLISSPTSSGFYADISSSATYVYMAIRRPHKPPEAGTDVFDVQTSADDGGSGTLTSTSVIADFTLTGVRGSGWDKWVATRLLSNAGLLRPNSSAAQASYSQWSLDEQYGFRHTGFTASNSVVDYTFRRAPGFLDCVAFEGTGSARTIAHNLAAVPKMIIVKKRDSGESWSVYTEAYGNNKTLWLNDNSGGVTSTQRWNSTTPTDSVFSVGTDTGTNGSGGDYIAYLFGDVSGVSKVGSYTGTGSTINVDCGFTAGARFVLIKRYGGDGEWYVWDSARGINAGNDPYLELNTQAAEVTNTDYIDPLNAGFTVSTTNGDLNASGGTYIFLAIA